MRKDISKNCLLETIPWMIILIGMFTSNVIIGLIDWFPASMLVILIWETLYVKYRQDAIIEIIEKEKKDGDIERIQ